MSATKVAARPAVRSGVVVPGAPLAPQVNLLPPEIRASRSLRTVKRLLALALVAVLALAGLGYAFAAMQASSARSEAEAEQAETRRLLAEQQQYAEVPQVLGALDSAEQARLLGTSTEVLWKPYLDELFNSAPPNVQFASISVEGATPMLAPPVPTDPLQEQSMLTLTFTGRSLTLPDAMAWVETLEAIDGFDHAYVQTAVSALGTDSVWADVVHFEVQGTVQVMDTAFENRFVEQEG